MNKKTNCNKQDEELSIYDLFRDYEGGSFQSELIDFGEDIGTEKLES